MSLIGRLTMDGKNKRFISKKEADLVLDKVAAAFGPVLADFINRDGERRTDMIRFMSVAHRCKEARERKALSVQEVASLLKVPQYRIKAIEDSRMTEVNPDTLEKYIDLLGILRWFNEWAKSNADVHQRILDSCKKV